MARPAAFDYYGHPDPLIWADSREADAPSDTTPRTSVCGNPRSCKDPGPVALVTKTGRDQIHLRTDGAVD
jgi:hypothetical protein